MSPREKRLWQSLMSRSFLPQDWWMRDDELTAKEARIMWVYRENYSRWEVGYYTPDKQWTLESVQISKNDAARRVHWLNGGNYKEVSSHGSDHADVR